MERDAKGLAIVIRSIPVRDYDRLLTLFSPSLGLMNVVSYGARKSVRSVKAPLYTEGNFSLEKGRRGWSLKDIDVISTHEGRGWSLKDIDVISTHEGLHDDLDISQSAMLFSDLILVSRTAEPELYSLYVSALDALESHPYEKVVNAFVTCFLLQEGLSGDYISCPSCGKFPAIIFHVRPAERYSQKKRSSVSALIWVLLCAPTVILCR